MRTMTTKRKGGDRHFRMLSALQFSVDVTVEGNDACMHQSSHADVLVVDE